MPITSSMMALHARNIELAPLALHHLDRHGVASVDAEPLGQPAREQNAFGAISIDDVSCGRRSSLRVGRPITEVR